MKKQIIWFAAFSTAVVISACSNSAQTLPDPVNTPEVEMQMSGEIPESPTRQLVIETPTPPPATVTVLPAEEPTLPEISMSDEAEVDPTSPPALGNGHQNNPSDEKMISEDPANWDLEEFRPDSDNPDFILYTLSEEQIQMAVEPIRNFYNGMYYSERLLTLEEASQWIDTTSQAWIDTEQGFQASHDSFASFGYYPQLEFSIEDPAYFTEWDIYAAKSPEGDIYVQVKFRIEEQRFTVFDQTSGEVIVSNPYWGPRLTAFQTAFRDGHWKIIFRHEENLGMKTLPTPSQ
jgi:hypothetical protein